MNLGFSIFQEKRILSASRLVDSYQLKEEARLAERVQMNILHKILKHFRCLLRQMASKADRLMRETQMPWEKSYQTKWIPLKPIRLYIFSKRTEKSRKIQVPQKTFSFTLGRRS